MAGLTEVVDRLVKALIARGLNVVDVEHGLPTRVKACGSTCIELEVWSTSISIYAGSPSVVIDVIVGVEDLPTVSALAKDLPKALEAAGEALREALRGGQ